MKRIFKLAVVLFSIFAVNYFSPDNTLLSVPLLLAHCDTMDGPLIIEAKLAFEKGDIAPVLKWVSKNDEKAIKEIFNMAQKAAKQGKESKELAQMYFLENLVRIHRADEGAAYTGIKPSGFPVDEAVVLGDKALESGSIDKLSEMLSGHVKKEIENRFHKAMELKKNSAKNPKEGREYIEAYISYIHFVENLHGLIKNKSHGHASEKHEE